MSNVVIQQSTIETISNAIQKVIGKLVTIVFNNDGLYFNPIIQQLEVSETEYNYNFGEQTEEYYIFSILKHNIESVCKSDDLMTIKLKSGREVYIVASEDFENDDFANSPT